ncbi:MAG: PIN domain-containing protein [Nanoarchaeota archaeon]
MEIILDTSFILTCIKEQVDFTQAEEFGRLLLPELVFDELKKLRGKSKGKEKEQAELALDIIENKREKFRIIKLEGNYADAGMVKYVEGRKDVIVATMDKELKKVVQGKARILVIRARKKLELV